ncbi:hypothetical protein NQ318_011328 [Aromia moschata]|uniref:Uncharacterized protein n=1 Tax=Aromia moschata TaxID=1265417 RepID=A0AAV8XBS0_9CUCU|nr:hypothetical protein NQ318_011328 [Aromia moschata]
MVGIERSYQDDEEGVAFDGTAGSFPKDFGYGAFDGDHDILSSSGDQKTKNLINGSKKIWKVVNPKSCFP